MTLPETYTVFLPVIMNTTPPSYGVQLSGALTIPIVQNRIYHVSVAWQEPQPWIPDAASAIDPNPLILGTRTCPPEYRLFPDRMGSPPKPEHNPRIVEMVRSLVERYHPWGFEFWREPDCPVYSVPPENQYWYGAWVVNEDYYAAGRAYGDLLSMIYPVLKSTGCKVLGGALQNGHLVQGREFLRGMLETGRCDFVSFHVYPFFGEDYKKVVEQAVQSVRSMTYLPLFVTETALLTRGEDTPEFQAAQVDYYHWQRDYFGQIGIPSLWYSGDDNGWYKCGFKRNGKLMPVYYAWRA